MDLSVLVVSYNTKSYLDPCIHSILASQTRFQFEIILVDNNSADGSVEMVQDKYPTVRIVRNKFNYGFSVGMNQGYQLSRGRYIMSFNPDAELFPDTIEQAVRFMDEHPNIGKIGLATVTNNRVDLPSSTFRKYNELDLPSVLGLRNREEKEGPLRTPIQVEWIFGTGLVVRRSALRPDFIYRELSFLFWEEYDLSLAVRKKGFDIYLVPGIRIIHHASVTFKKHPERIFWARLLSHAHEKRVRTEFYGKWNSLINSLLFYADNQLIFLLLWAKSIVSRHDPAREVELVDRKARFRAALKVLFSNSADLVTIDRQAARFFNNGEEPVYPPQTF